LNGQGYPSFFEVGILGDFHMALTVTDIKEIASRSGGMVLDARKYSATDLKEIASRAKGKGSRIYLNNIEKLTATDLKEIASRGDGAVVFDLT
jgi:nitrous oxidase accessory protein NosD